MRNKLFLPKAMLLAGCLTLGLTACIGESPKPEPEDKPLVQGELSKSKIALVVEKAAPIACQVKMKDISPQTGDDPKYAYDVERINYNEQNQHATVELKVSWKASPTQLFSNRKTCEMSGTLSINFVNRKSGVITATFIPRTYNDWTKECAKSYNMSDEAILKPITFDPLKTK